jgi:hypothetical protein
VNAPLRSMGETTRERRRRGGRVAAMLLAAATLAAGSIISVAGPAQALPVDPRLFSCTGGLGEAFTQRTVTGKLTLEDRPYDVQVIETGTGVVENYRPSLATNRGGSWLDPGRVEWGVSVPNPGHNRYRLHMPGVLPGGGGYFDAYLEILFAGGANGSWQIPMFDCTVTRGPAYLSTPPSPRAFSCTGSLGEAFTQRTVTGLVTRRNRPYSVYVVQTGTGVEESYRSGGAADGLPSWLHQGYLDWGVTGPNPNRNVYRLHIPPVLPRAGGWFDADLKVLFAGGVNGSWQIPMFDCAVSQPVAP